MKRHEGVALTLEALGLGVAVMGVALISAAAACIVGGLSLVAFGVAIERKYGGRPDAR